MPHDVPLWTFIAVIVVASLLFRYFENKNRYRLIQAFVEKGQPVPKELLQKPQGRRRLFGGLLLMLVGIATAVYLYAQYVADGSQPDESFLPFTGIFPFAVGLAMSLTTFIERRLNKTSDD